MIGFQQLNAFFVVIFLSSFLLGCQTEQTDNQQTKPPALTEKNINAFMHTMANDYLTLASSLKQAAHKYEKSDNADGFISYRNKEWTPLYIEKKRLYEKTYELNQHYLLKTQQTKPFEIFTDLIYTGLNYKHSLQKHDHSIMQAADSQLDANSAYMERLAAS